MSDRSVNVRSAHNRGPRVLVLFPALVKRVLYVYMDVYLKAVFHRGVLCVVSMETPVDLDPCTTSVLEDVAKIVTYDRDYVFCRSER